MRSRHSPQRSRKSFLPKRRPEVLETAGRGRAANGDEGTDPVSARMGQASGFTAILHGVRPAHESRETKARGQRSSESRPSETGTAGTTAFIEPLRIHARWLGAKRGANSPSLISRVTANRPKLVAGRKRRALSSNPSLVLSTSPSTDEITPSPF